MSRATDAFVGWLRSLGRDGLVDVIALRHDVLTPTAPRDLPDLATQLTDEAGVLHGLQDVDMVALQLAELFVFAGPTSRAELTTLLGEGSAVDPVAVDAALTQLRGRALLYEARSHGVTRLVPVESLRTFFPNPLGLGQPMRALLGGATAELVTRVARTLGVQRGKTRSQTHGAVVAHLTAERIRAIVATAPPEARDLLELLAWEGAAIGVDPGTAIRLLTSGIAAGNDRNGVAWAVDRALVVPASWDLLVMPREVGLALRGPDWHPPLITTAPRVHTAAADTTDVEREAGAAAAALVDLVSAVMETVATTPSSMLKTGGVGVREVRRLAKQLGHAEVEVVLALQLAGEAGLLTGQDGELLPTAEFDAWRVAEPAHRLIPLLVAWWVSDGPVTERTDQETERAMPPLADAPVQEDVRRLRHGLLAAVAELPAGTGAVHPEAVIAAVQWRRPWSFPASDRALGQGLPIWREAEMLGLVARGAASSLGRGLLAGDDERLCRRAAELLPGATGTATFQGDLTAIVAGTPAAQLVELLDGAADRESRGGASVWRFSPASVRRWLDRGGTAEALLDRLHEVSPRELPQPLVYLVRDAGRRHGEVTVAPVACCVTSKDTAMLAEIAVTRSLASLGLRLLAPTVLAGAKPVAETLEALRRAGWSPVEVSAAGELVVAEAPRRRAPVSGARGKSGRSEDSLLRTVARLRGTSTRRKTTQVVEPRKLAETLLATESSPPARGRDDPQLRLLPPVNDMQPHVAHLRPDEIALLTSAAEHGTALRISYVDGKGRSSLRVVSDIDIDPPYFGAFCHLRQDDRTFALAQIRSVAPA